MKLKLLAILSAFLPLAQHPNQENTDSRRFLMSSMTPDSARGSLALEEFGERRF